MKVCIGSGHHRFDGFVHVDMNPNSKADVTMDALTYFKNLDDGVVDKIIAWHVLEHIPWSDLEKLIHEMYRASSHKCVWSIRVPHCTSIHAANPQHVNTFSTTFWNFWADKPCITLERYGSARICVESTRLHILALATGVLPRSFARIMPNWIFNSFGKTWQMICERFWPFRFDEISWKIRVVK